MIKRLLLTLSMVVVTGVVMADELLQVIPQTIVAGHEDGEEFIAVEMINDDNVYVGLQFDVYLPQGVRLLAEDDGPVYLSDERFDYVTKKGVTTCSHSYKCTDRSSEGFYRIQIFGTKDNAPIHETSGVLCELYYTSDADVSGIQPVRIENVVLGISGTQGVKPVPNVSFVYTDDTDWASVTSLDLATEGCIVTKDVAAKAQELMVNPNSLMYVNEGSVVDKLQNIVVGDQCASLVLADGYPFNAPKAFTAAEASYTRTIGDDGWYSLCLPFAADAPAGVDVQRFASLDASGGVVYFSDGGIEADKPCIFSAKAGAVTFTASNAAIAATPESLDDDAMSGTYAGKDAGTITGSYALRGDGTGFGVCDASAYVTPFRAILNAPGKSSMIRLATGGLSTGIATPDADAKPDSAAYNLQGQAVAVPANGIFITNRKKQLFK